MKNILNLGSITLGLGLMLSPLCQAQQWSSEQNLGGDPTSLIAPIQVPGTNILQIFYRGTDNALWTQWRNADGNWPGQQESLGGQLAGDPVALQIPGTSVIQIFYTGMDNALWTIWRNPDGSWSNMQSLGGQLASDPAVAQVPGTNVLQVFYHGMDGALWTIWRNADGTSWSNMQSLGGSLFKETCDDPTNPSCYGVPATPVPIQIPNTNDLEVFYRGSNNHLQAFLRSPNQSWSFQDFGGNMASDPSAAPVPGANLVQVFYQGGGGCQSDLNSSVPACEASGGGLMTQWGNLSSWTHETHMAGHLEGYWCSDYEPEAAVCLEWSANYGVPKAYTQPATNDVWVIYPGADGGIYNSYPSLWGQERTPDGTWQSEFSLNTYAPTMGAGASDVTYAQIPGTNDMQIFYSGFEFNASSGSVYNVLTKWVTQ